MTIQEKEKDFRMACNAFRNEFPGEMVEKFFEYWTEPNKSGTKLKWELEKTWDIKRRLKRWFDNENKWHGNNNTIIKRNLGSAAGAEMLLNRIKKQFNG